jgi:hypothetical protein
MKTSLGIWALGPMVTRFVPGGYKPGFLRESTVERVGPYTEDAVAAGRRGVYQWRYIDDVAERSDDDALRRSQAAKDAVRAYELVYAAPGAG